MKRDEFLVEAATALRGHDLVTSNSTTRAFADPRYLNPKLLTELPDDAIRRSINTVVNEIATAFGEELRRENLPVQPEHVQMVLSRRFCSLPPFCK